MKNKAKFRVQLTACWTIFALILATLTFKDIGYGLSFVATFAGILGIAAFLYYHRND